MTDCRVWYRPHECTDSSWPELVWVALWLFSMNHVAAIFAWHEPNKSLYGMWWRGLLAWMILNLQISGSCGLHDPSFLKRSFNGLWNQWYFQFLYINGSKGVSTQYYMSMLLLLAHQCIFKYLFMYMFIMIMRCRYIER